MTIVISEDQFNSEVLQADVPVLVDFFSIWCGPCQRIAPLIDELDAEADGRFRVVLVDAEQELLLADLYSVERLPTLLVFEQGEVIHRLVGVQEKVAILTALGCSD